MSSGTTNDYLLIKHGIDKAFKEGKISQEERMGALRKAQEETQRIRVHHSGHRPRFVG